MYIIVMPLFGNGKLFLLAVHVEDGSQQPISEAPEVIVLNRVGGEKTAGKHLYAFMQAGILKSMSIQPDGTLDFTCRQLQWWRGGKSEEKWLYVYWLMKRMTGSFMPEPPLQLTGGQEDAGFLLGLPNAGGKQIYVPLFSSAAGKGEMPRPWILWMSRPPKDQIALVSAETLNYGNSGRGCRRRHEHNVFQVHREKVAVEQNS